MKKNALFCKVKRISLSANVSLPCNILRMHDRNDPPKRWRYKDNTVLAKRENGIVWWKIKRRVLKRARRAFGESFYPGHRKPPQIRVASQTSTKRHKEGSEWQDGAIIMGGQTSAPREGRKRKRSREGRGGWRGGSIPRHGEGGRRQDLEAPWEQREKMSTEGFESADAEREERHNKDTRRAQLGQ